MRLTPPFRSASIHRSTSNTMRKTRSLLRVSLLVAAVAVTAIALGASSSSASSLGQLFTRVSAIFVDQQSTTTSVKAAPVSPTLNAVTEAPLSPSATMLVERRGHTATRLSDGRVLIAGGENSSGPLNQAEIYDPADATFSAAGNMNEARADHTATLLGDGRVLLAGGRNAAGSLTTTEIFDPTTGTFTSGPTMSVARAGHSATLFADGRILFAGGDGSGSAEILNAALNGSTAAGSLNTARSYHSAALMQDGNVLIVGGRDSGGNELSSGEVFNGSGFNSVGGSLTVARVQPLLRVLFDGKVQVIGGSNDGSLEIYDPQLAIFGAYAHVLPEGDTCASLPGQVQASQTRAALFHNGQTDATFDRTSHSITEMGSHAIVVGGVNSSNVVLGSTPVFASSNAAITTDKLDYSPGETAHIAGRGFQAGETVRLKIHEDPHTPQERGLDVVADGDGSFVGDYLVADYDLNMKFIVGARGLTSGLTAQTTFTDARNWKLPFAGTGTGSVTISVSSGNINLPVGCGGTGTNVSGPVTVTSSCGGPSNNITTSDNTATVTFNASAASGSTFGGWSAPSGLSTSTCTGTTNPCAVTFSGNGSLTVTFNANANTTTTIASSLNPSIFGDSVTFTSSVKVGATAVTSGSVIFIEGGTCATPTTILAGPTALNGSGQAAFSTSTLTSPSHTITACYGGASGFNSSSGNLTQTVNKANQTITFGALGDKTYGDPAFVVSATGGASGNPVTFSASGNCSSSGTNGSTITITGAGSCTVTASQAGNTNYNAATDVLRSFTINKATLTVTAGNASREYGDANPSFTASYSGFVNGETLATSGVTGSPSLTTAATPSSSVGGSPYTITAAVGTLAAANYQFTFVNGQLTITKATLNVTADNASREYGDSNPSFTAGYSGFKNGELLGTSDVSGNPSLTTTATATSAVGGSPYTITAAVGTLVSGNYTFTFTNGSLTITKATLTVTADNSSRQYGDPNPTFTASYTGFKNAETLATSGVTGSPSLTSTATAASTVAGSPYVITAGLGTLASGNYQFSFVNGELTITPRQLDITANNQSKTYGDTFTFAGTEFSTGAGQLVNGDAVNSVSLTSAGSAATATVAGSPYAIVASAAIGTGLGNYDISYHDGSLAINARQLDITANNQSKTYGDTFTFAGTEFSTGAGQLVNGDAVNSVTLTSAGADAAATVAGSPYAIEASAAVGTGLGNYVIAYHDGSLAVNLRPITVTAQANTKVYDGNTSALAIPLVTTGSLASGDTGTFTETYDNRDVGSGKTMTPAGTIKDGSNVDVTANYDITFTTSTNGTISTRPITVTAQANTKVYDGNTSAAAIPLITLGTLASGDTGTFSETYDNRNVGSGKTMTPAGTVKDGSNVDVTANYDITFAISTNGTISTRPITVTAQANTKVYDGNTSAAAIPLITLGTLASGDTGTFSETYDNRNAGTGKTMTPAGTIKDGSNVDVTANYGITFATSANGTIDKCQITVTAVTSTKMYDGNTSSSNTPIVTSGAIVSGDTANFTQTYDTPLVGTNKTLTPAGSVTDGNGGMNYDVTFANVTTGVITTAFCFNGFLSPIGGSVQTVNGGSYAYPVRSFKLGSTIPVKFAISALNGTTCGAPVTTGIHTLQAMYFSSATTSETAIDATPTDSATTGNQFRLTDSEWHFNLSTKGGFKAGTWLLQATLQDGSIHTVWIAIKK